MYITSVITGGGVGGLGMELFEFRRMAVVCWGRDERWMILGSGVLEEREGGFLILSLSTDTYIGEKGGFVGGGGKSLLFISSNYIVSPHWL